MRSASLRYRPHVHTTYVSDLWYAAHGRARAADFFRRNPLLCIPTNPLLPSTLVRLRSCSSAAVSTILRVPCSGLPLILL